ncbi:MAG: hypothetical protein AAGG44_05815 [Planctomycetota bacterium]
MRRLADEGDAPGAGVGLAGVIVCGMTSNGTAGAEEGEWSGAAMGVGLA